MARFDAPFHFSDFESADKIPAADLVGLLSIINIRDRAEGDPDATVSLQDIKGWERKHGRIPARGIVAMYSGWESRIQTRETLFGIDTEGKPHVPGFSLEAAQFLASERNVKGLVVDSPSLEPGKDFGLFPLHKFWLAQRRWGAENVANLGQLPPRGATIVVGAPKIAGCTGGISRIFALV